MRAVSLVAVNLGAALASVDVVVTQRPMRGEYISDSDHAHHDTPDLRQKGRTMTRTPNKWDREFAADLAERVGATFLGALLATITLTGTTSVDWSDGKAVWAVLGVPTLVSLIKGLLANLANGDSGASLLPVPPGPDVNAT